MLGLAGQGFTESLLLERAVLAQATAHVSLKFRKQLNDLDVILTGVGDGAQVGQERSTNSSWQAIITRPADSLLAESVAQKLAMPEMGLAHVRLNGSGSTYELEMRSVDDVVLPKPKIFFAGADLVLRFEGLSGVVSSRSGDSLDLSQPAQVPQKVVVPPLRSRATAPPLGDMAVGSMLISNPGFVPVSGPPVTLTLNNAPARDALMSLARLGGYGFVYVGSSSELGLQEQGFGGLSSDPSGVTMSFRDERYDRALNSLLIAAGLQAKLDGRTLYVGEDMAFQPVGLQMSKVFRLNQVQPDKAADYLANLGALISVTSTEATAEIATEQGSSGTSPQSSVITLAGPLVGLTGTTDTRLGTITLIGDPQLINVAEAYLRQIDLRRRQVAVKVQILNVELENMDLIDSSFSARMGGVFVVSENGNGYINFGANKPGDSSGAGTFSSGASGTPGSYDATPASTNVYTQPSQSFYSYLEAQLVASDAETLAQPTLMVQEGQKATVETGEEVIVNVSQNENGDTGTTTYTYEKETAGLTLELDVSKIDDNGFITMDVNPSVSIPVPAPEGSGAQTGGVQLFNLNKRDLKSGTIRLRDGQTLILTGVVSETQLEAVRKWPILGDIPWLGSLFRKTSTSRSTAELVILVTPRVLDDEQGGVYGYGYKPSTEASRTFLQNQQ